MKIVEIMGGLGNQMFQYAFYRKLKKLCNDEVKIDIDYFTHNKCHNGYELDRVFNIKEIPATNYECYLSGKENDVYIKSNFLEKFLFKLTKRKHYYAFTDAMDASRYNKDALSTDKKYISGWWANERYFKDIAETIKQIYRFPRLERTEDLELMYTIKEKDSVSLHVRRGDYLRKEHYFVQGICTRGYYRNAIHFIRSKLHTPHFVVFSNDIDWCKKEFNMMNCSFVDWHNGEESFRDMQLMSLCKYNIIANSSFSWWGAWLNSNRNKIVCCPTRMINIRSPLEGEFPDDWIRISGD